MKMKGRFFRGSEVQDFLSCRKKWEYRWAEEVLPNVLDKKLVFGIAFHKLMEYLHSDPNNAYARFEEWLNEQETQHTDQVTYDEMIELLYGIANGYIEKYKQADAWTTTIGTEVHFRIPLGGSDYYDGTIDWVKLTLNDKVRFADHKTVSSIGQYNDISKLDRQISRYWWALEQLTNGRGYIEVDGEWLRTPRTQLGRDLKGKKIECFEYDLILKDIPKEPKILGSGKLSTDKSQRTTYEKFTAKMQELDIPLDDPAYESVLSALNSSRDTFFKRLEIQRSPAECQAAMDDFKLAIKDIKRKPSIYRNTTKDCKTFCSYFHICSAEVNDENVEMVRSLLYKTADKAM